MRVERGRRVALVCATAPWLLAFASALPSGGGPVHRQQSALGRHSAGRRTSRPRRRRFESGQNDPNAQMLVRADELQYDNTNNRILAIGNVQIYYKRSTLEADRVVYEQNTKRMRAEGNARFTEADGKVVHGEIIDLTDEFRDGFVDSLQLEAADKTRFAAPRAERQGGRYTVVPERRLHRVRALQGRSAQAAALAGARDAHHPRRHREDDLFRGRAARILRRAAVLLAVSFDARSDGQAQERLARSEDSLFASQYGGGVSRCRISGRSRRTTTSR